MGSLFVTEELKKRFIVTFREVFAVDPDFPYNNDDTSNTILISGKYAKPAGENFLPQIIVGPSNYSTVNTTLFNNFQREVKVNPGAPKTITGAEFTNVINFAAVIDCISTVKAESEKVADKVFNAMNSGYVWLFQDGAGLNIRALSVAESVPKQQYPQYTFMTSVSVQGDFNLTWTAYAPPEKDVVLQKIKTQLVLDLSNIDPIN